MKNNIVVFPKIKNPAKLPGRGRATIINFPAQSPMALIRADVDFFEVKHNGQK